MFSPERYRERQRRLCEYLADGGLEAAVLVDLEGRRDSSMRYLSGHPQDALLFVFVSGETLLLPWDVPLAEAHAVVGRVKAFEEYGRSEELAIRSVLEEAHVKSAELPGTLSYPLVKALKRSLSGTSLSCRSDGLARRLQEWRALKDDGELVALRRACEITNELLQEIEAMLAAGEGIGLRLDGRPAARSDLRSPGSGIREVELALHLEFSARERGAEGMGFDTLAAGPERSFAIHCFPSVSSGSFAGPGLSILDFGVVVDGYTSDVTLTVVHGPLSSRQQAMLEAVQGAYELAVSLCAPGVEPFEVAVAAEQYLKQRGFRMPHSLGHGIGLEAHEGPVFRTRKTAGGNAPPLAPGMVFTLEPGLYAPGEGGVRLENDFLCTPVGVEVLTRSRLIRI